MAHTYNLIGILKGGTIHKRVFVVPAQESANTGAFSAMTAKFPRFEKLNTFKKNTDADAITNALNFLQSPDLDSNQFASYHLTTRVIADNDSSHRIVAKWDQNLRSLD